MFTFDNSKDIENSLATNENVGNESINIVIDNAEDIDEEDQDKNVTIERQSAMSRLSRISPLDGRRSALSMISYVNREFDQTWIGLVFWVFVVTIAILLCLLAYNWWMFARQSHTTNNDFTSISLHR